MAYDAVTFKIVEHIGVISERIDFEGNKWSKEVNMVSWNGKAPKVDIREWNADHKKMGRGLTLTAKEEEMLCMVLHSHMQERSK